MADVATQMTEEDAPSGYPRKRRQTRRRLIQAGMHVLAARGTSSITAGEIATEAGVATGTFYNHFPTVDDFITEVAQDVMRGMEIERDTLATIEHDPARRIAIGLLQLLHMADTDPDSASTFVILSAVRPEFRAQARALVTQAIADGVEAGSLHVSIGPAATNAVIGATLQSMRSRVLGETDGSEAAEVALLVLRLLGMADAEAETIVTSAMRALAA